MQYVYAALWFAIALLLIFKMGKENRIFYVAGSLFVIFGIWWLVSAISPELEVFAGVPGIIFKVLIAIVLVLCGFTYYQERKKTQKDNTDKPKK